MADSKNYDRLDDPSVLNCLFHPRGEDPFRQPRPDREDLLIPIGPDVHISASSHFVSPDAPMLLFFHGNGEIVADYDDLAILFTRMGINFFAVDYRGYGASTGQPSVTAMMTDCHAIFEYVKNYREKKEMTGSFVLMGRSLGSASVIELAATKEKDFHALIIESGFAYAAPLLETLGVDLSKIGYTEEKGFDNVDKIKQFTGPCLIIHAQYDHIIPFSDGQALFNAVGSKDKILFEVKGANHNDLLMRDMEGYMSHVKQICFA